jgi:hypothetical protein
MRVADGKGLFVGDVGVDDGAIAFEAVRGGVRSSPPQPPTVSSATTIAAATLALGTPLGWRAGEGVMNGILHPAVYDAHEVRWADDAMAVSWTPAGLAA